MHRALPCVRGGAGDRQRRELEGLRPDDTTFPLELSLSEVRGQGAERRFAGVIRDITLRKQAEEALRCADPLKDEFLANTSHELRTPLNGIIGICRSMLDGATGRITDDQRRNLGMIVASGRRLANLVNDLLDFSKVPHEKIELRYRPTDLHALADLVLTVFRALVGRRPLRLFNRIDSSVPLVEADDERVQQILFNLVRNAVKFTPAGSVEVSARSNQGWLQVTASDNGPGIAHERFGRIFDSFTQGDGSAIREQGGTALGLTISRKLVELHGGIIRVEAELGSGSHSRSVCRSVARRRAMLAAPDREETEVSRVLADLHFALDAGGQEPVSAGRGGRHHKMVVDD